MQNITKLVHETIQGLRGIRMKCCARCTRPIEGQEVFTVTRYTYGPCCIMQVEEERK